MSKHRGQDPCPICNSVEREDALGRAAALCAECGSLERHRALARMFGEMLADGGDRHCLEAGPANRRIYGEYLEHRGWSYKSVDRWREGNPRDPRAVGFVDYETDLGDLSMFDDDEFDLFIAQHVIEEIEDYERALDEVARVLRNGGKALLEIPFDSSRERSQRQSPDHFGNVWLFGADLPDRLRRRFAEVEVIPFSEDGYRGTLLACTTGKASPRPDRSRRGGESASVAENELPGDGEWWSNHKAPGRTIEGYASWPSVEAGRILRLHVSTTPAARYRITVHRLGWYGGEGGRTMAVHPQDGDVQGFPQPVPAIGPGPSVPSCRWPVTDTIQAGDDWASGQYVAKLTLTEGEFEGNVAFVPFVVRAPLESRADVLVQMPVTTAQAYNDWGGKSLYPSSSSEGVPAVKVSFQRPFPNFHDANLNARWPFVWDIQLIRFLEREGYDVAYTTDLDTHREPWGLLGHPLVMTSGHDEYWSVEMRDAFDALRDSGTSLACMGANTCYWQARFEDDERTMVQYRRHTADPETDPALQTVRWRDLDSPRPEAELWGVQYQGGVTVPNLPPRDYELTESCAGDPWLHGTGFQHPATLKGLVGYEWDAIVKGEEPPGATVFFEYPNEISDANVVRHRTAAGGIAFGAGSLQFSWGLDDWGQGLGDVRLQRLMKNGLDEMIAVGSAALPAPVEPRAHAIVIDSKAIEDLPLPPERMRYMAEDDERFIAIGDEIVADLRQLVGLGDGDSVIDIGCGYGRLAHALMRDPRYDGRYLGLDILSGPIEWCQTVLGPSSGNRFSFREIEVANARYRPDAKTPGHHAALGVAAASFDVAALISVFTHLDPPTAERYLAEIAAALAPAGRALVSVFLLDDSWRACEEAGTSPLRMSHQLTEFCRYHDADDPLAAIGYDPEWLLAKAAAVGLEPISAPRLGSWCGRVPSSGYQDAIALRRTAP